ncbi:MAG: hypothetical protein ACI9ND_002601 [Yoonia sp.]|jgi:hypothetical protein
MLRMVINMFVSKGINAASKGGRDPKDMTPEERRAAQSKRKNMGRVHQAVNILRRFIR